MPRIIDIDEFDIAPKQAPLGPRPWTLASSSATLEMHAFIGRHGHVALRVGHPGYGAASALYTCCSRDMEDQSIDLQPSAVEQQTAKQSYATLEEELENLACRFIVNLPANELASIERIGFHLELAYVWAH